MTAAIAAIPVEMGTGEPLLRRMSAFVETVRTLPGFVPVARFGGARARVQHVRLFNEANEKAVS